MHAVSYDFPSEAHFAGEALADYSTQLIESRLIGVSGWAERARRLILRLAATDDTVCLEGESGAGKGLIASLIHQCSPRREGPFVTLTITSASIEVTRSVLLGSSQTYSTEGVKDEKGLIELAQGGTLYIKRISYCPGSSVLVDDLLNLLRQLRFNNRLEGHARILLGWSVQRDGLEGNGLRSARGFEVVRIPPLRERPEDIEALTLHFVNQHCLWNQKELRIVSPEALKAMSSYDWPQNVFELKALVRNLVAQSGPPAIDASLLPAYVGAGTNCNAEGFPASGIDLDNEIRQREMELICGALKHCHGLQAKAARLLRIKPTTLFMKIQRYGIDVHAFR
jgi:DNA-binding NtrC family response regulator